MKKERLDITKNLLDAGIRTEVQYEPLEVCTYRTVPSFFFFLSFFFIHNSLCLDSLLFFCFFFFFLKENLYPNSGVKYGHITFAHFIQLIKATLSVAYCIRLDTEPSINMESAMTHSVARPIWLQPANGTVYLNTRSNKG